MASSDVAKEIAELEALRKQTQWWRWGTMGAILVVVLICVSVITDSVQGLAQAGPRQKEFTDQLSKGLQDDVVPRVQTIAAGAITEIQPLVQEELNKLNERTPELSDAAMKQLDLLQQNLPDKGAEVLAKTFGKTLDDLEPEIKKMFPEIDDAKIVTLVKNITDESHNRLTHAHDTLFSGHLKALESISTNIKKIQGSEKLTGQESQANWEMAILLVDLFHEDLKDLRAMEAAQNKAKSAAPTDGKDKGGKDKNGKDKKPAAKDKAKA